MLASHAPPIGLGGEKGLDDGSEGAVGGGDLGRAVYAARRGNAVEHVFNGA